MTEPQMNENQANEQHGTQEQQTIAASGVNVPGAGRVTASEEAELDQEVAAALGDMSLMDMYEMGSSAKAAKGKDAVPAPAMDGVCRGKVISVSGDDIFIDLGGKSQGVLPREELSEGESLEVGQMLDVVIVRYDSRDGLLILSKKSAEQRMVRRNVKEGSLVEARVVGTNKGGLEMDIKGIRAFMPISQIDMYRVEDLEQFMNQRFVCEVVEVEKGDKNIVLSRRNVLEREYEEKKEQVWKEVQEGQMRHGVVRSIMDYGAFVDIGGVDGLLHVREISWSRVNHPGDVLKPGQGVDVKVIGVDQDHRRISLSLKQAAGDPWALVEHKYPVKSRHTAKIVKLMDFGAFAELEPGVEGLIPIGQMTWAGRVKHPSDVVQVGGMVEVEIAKLEMDKCRISLSMKSLQENPWSKAGQKYVADAVYMGKVMRTTDFGAFVQLEPGIEGLVHISELSDKRVNRVTDVVKEGAEIQVKVLEVDPKNQRISLSSKESRFAAPAAAEGAAATPAPAASAAEAPGQKKKKEKQRPRRGGLDWNW